MRWCWVLYACGPRVLGVTDVYLRAGGSRRALPCVASAQLPVVALGFEDGALAFPVPLALASGPSSQRRGRCIGCFTISLLMHGVKVPTHPAQLCRYTVEKSYQIRQQRLN